VNGVGWLDLEAYARTWRRVGGGDPYFAPAYLRAAALIDEGEPAAFVHDGVVYPFLCRTLPEDRMDLSTAYGIGGPHGRGNWRAAFRRECERRGVVSEFIRFHPLRANHLGLPDVTVRPMHDVFTVDLQQDDDGLLGQMRTNARWAVRRAQRLSVVARPSDDLGAFHSLYLQTMHRVAAEPFYFFPIAYLELLSEIGDQLLLVSSGTAAGVYLLGDDVLYYHLGGTSAEGRQTHAMNLVHFEAMRAGRRLGLRRLHLGGGLRQGDSLHRFKQSVGAGRAVYYQGTAIHDPSAYRELCATAGVAHERDGYFPAYRASAAVSASVEARC